MVLRGSWNCEVARICNRHGNIDGSYSSCPGLFVAIARGYIYCKLESEVVYCNTGVVRQTDAQISFESAMMIATRSGGTRRISNRNSAIAFSNRNELGYSIVGRSIRHYSVGLVTAHVSARVLVTHSVSRVSQSSRLRRRAIGHCEIANASRAERT